MNCLSNASPADCVRYAGLLDHQLVNIEIVGASHFDYMRRDDTLSNMINAASPQDEAWNRAVANFVTDVTLNSESYAKLSLFLESPPPQYQGMIVREGDKWVIRLPRV